MSILDDFPILKFRPEDGDDVLLGYQLTDQEQATFAEMDQAGLSIPEDSELEAYWWCRSGRHTGSMSVRQSPSGHGPRSQRLNRDE
jgi:hypothetical protein